MKPNEILAGLMLKNTRPSEIARRLKIHRCVVSNIIHGRSYSRRVQEEIAKILEKDVDEVWPPHRVA